MNYSLLFTGMHSHGGFFMFSMFVLCAIILNPEGQTALEAMIQGTPIQSAQDAVSIEFGGGFLLPESPDLADEAILRQLHRMAFGLQPDGLEQLAGYITSNWDAIPVPTRNLWREFAGRTGIQVPVENATGENLTSLLRYAAETGTELPDVNPDDLTDLQRYYYVMSIPQGRVDDFRSDPCWAVRLAVITRNPNSAFQMLDDPSPAIRLQAAKATGRADLLLGMSSMEGPIGPMALAGVGQVPILTDSLYRSKNPAIRASALLALLDLGWNIPEERLDFLLTDDYIMVRAIAADAAGRNFAMPAEGSPEYLPPLEDVPNKVVISTDAGDFEMLLLKDAAPMTCRSFWHLAETGFYDGIFFHRVIPGFVAQAGCPEGNGFGGPGYVLPAENNTEPYTRGTVGMADSGMNTGGSQFFIMLDSQRRLDCRYTAFGRLTDTDGIDDIAIGTEILEIHGVNP